MRFSCIAALLGTVASLSGCQLGSRPDRGETETQRVDMTEKRVFLGDVSLVNESSQFVLIKTPINQRLTPGMPLESFRDGELSGELLFSPEQTYGFMTADIAHGAPAVGDAVYLRHVEDFEEKQSDRFKFQMEQFEREKNMSFLERRRHEREKRKAQKKGTLGG